MPILLVGILLGSIETTLAQNNFSLQSPGPTTPEVAKQNLSQNFEIDNAHTSIVFAVKHFGLSYTFGRFNKCSGSFSIEKDGSTPADFCFAFAAASIDTNNEERDKHLRGPDFFDSGQFPEINFNTTNIQKVDNDYLVTGDLQIRDQIRSVTLPVQMVGIGTGPFGEPRAGFITKFSIKRSEFGMNKMIGTIDDDVSISFSFEGVAE